MLEVGKLKKKLNDHLTALKLKQHREFPSNIVKKSSNGSNKDCVDSAVGLSEIKG